jgi:hypothetical protein
LKRGGEIFPIFGKTTIVRPNHEKVLSMTQRRGSKTEPFMSSLRLTM